MFRRFAIVLAMVFAAVFFLQSPAFAAPQQVYATGNPESCQGGQGQIDTATFVLTGIPADGTPPSITVNHNNGTSQTQTVNQHGFDGVKATYTAKLTAPLSDNRPAVVVVRDSWKGEFKLTGCTFRTLKAPGVFPKPKPCGDLTALPLQAFTLYVQNDNAVAVTYSVTSEQYGTVTIQANRYTTGSHEYTNPQFKTYNFTVTWPGGQKTVETVINGCKIDIALPSASPSPSSSATAAAAPSSASSATAPATRSTSKSQPANDDGFSAMTWFIIVMIGCSAVVIGGYLLFHVLKHWNDPNP